ncbi:hypothetical protein ACIBF5_20655 [Micromonospora sp. NPDC050417]|uniref:hypothetical protein n=1 Tax=Micromonospora sp. NPDC050417 TaxID=3364280 RepID=UPI0037B4887D
MPLSQGVDALTRLRRTIFRTPGPLRWVAIGTALGLVLLLVLFGVVFRTGLGIVPVVGAREPDGGNRVGAAAPIGIAPSPGTSPKPLPDEYLPLVLAAGKVCPELPAPRIAGQVMAASGFTPGILGEDGAEGVAQFRPELWQAYAPSTAASATDPAVAVPTLGRAMCGLVDELAPLDGDAYLTALAAFQWGPEAIREAGGLPDAPSLRAFADMVSDYTAYYARDPRLSGASPTPTRRTNPTGPTPSGPTGTASAPGNGTPNPTSPGTNPSGTPKPPATTTTAPPPPQTPVWQERVIRSGSALRPNQSWTSNRLELTLTGDGDIVLRDQGRTVWRSGTAGRGGQILVFQGDGNLVLYSRYGATLWSSRTARNNGATLVLRADGNVVISDDGRSIWQTGTAS